MRKVVCLHCGHSTVHTTRVRDTLCLPAHSTPGQARDCLGSRIPPVSTDAAIDAFRRRALEQAQLFRDDAERHWHAGTVDVAKKADSLRFGSVVGVYLPDAIRLEEICQVWLRAAWHGNYVGALVEAVATLAERVRTNDPAEELRAELARSAARDWIREARFSMLRDGPGGLTAEQFAALLGAF